MLIKKISLENYGLYAGKVDFDLTPRSKNEQKKTIILMGGKNGSGKTTLLDALRLAFYGKSILGNRVSKNDYKSFLQQQIHQGNNSLLPNTFAKVAVDFDHVSLGKYNNYLVERSWTFDNNTLREYLKIYTNGKLKENVNDEFWRGFIEEIIPERLSQLFFFDGEKIKDIAEDEKGNKVLADSIKILLGLDTVDRLKADLSIYTTKEIKNSSLTDYKKDWDTIEEKIKTTKEEISIKLEDLSQIRTKIDGNIADIKAWEDRLHSEGGLFALNRDTLNDKKTRLSTSIKRLEEKIKEECGDIYPFSLCPNMNSLLKDQIKKEIELKHHLIIQKEIKDFESEIISAFEASGELIDSSKFELSKLVSSIANTRRKEPEHLKGVAEILGFSGNASKQFLSTLENAETTTREKVKQHSFDLDNCYAQLRTITKEIGKSPKDTQLQLIFKELSLLNQRSGELQQKEHRLKEEINQKKYKLKELQRNLVKLIDQQKVKNKTQDRLSMVKTIQSILDKYYDTLKKEKIHQLNLNFSESFNRLTRKQKLINNIEIDPDTFAVTLFDKANNPIPKVTLSSGEKQLYAIAMLWSLAKTSGRPLPVIIDTPLGRLDSDHRNNLITNYFPMASHQVILLSTDTEIDQQLYKKLSSHVSHCFKLDYNQQTQSTTPVEEYFWKEPSVCQS
ncbi:MAG: DNA sulfur modification protein DndD [Deltaproteobacteria bacterium]|jgi:DNA sulfur modification protein DndD|nr:DNA sulfur modification protein DndD [Deltaproteobacteria bacterium]